MKLTFFDILQGVWIEDDTLFLVLDQGYLINNNNNDNNNNNNNNNNNDNNLSLAVEGS